MSHVGSIARVTEARAGGARVMVQVASADAARAAAGARADALIVQGVEAGSHGQSATRRRHGSPSRAWTAA